MGEEEICFNAYLLTLKGNRQGSSRGGKGCVERAQLVKKERTLGGKRKIKAFKQRLEHHQVLPIYVGWGQSH